MERIDDWNDYDANVNQISFRPLSIAQTKISENDLDWLTVAIQWPIDNQFYQTFYDHLVPYNHLLRLRSQSGFIPLSSKLIN